MCLKRDAKGIGRLSNAPLGKSASGQRHMKQRLNDCGRYFYLENSVGAGVGGVFTQTDGLYPGYDERAPQSMTLLTNDAFPDALPDLRFVLDPKARLTDAISVGNVGAWGLLVNARLREILAEYKIARHAFYDADVHDAHSVYRYSWLHIVPDDEEWIDFSRSRFAVYELPLSRIDKLRDVACKNRAEMIFHLENTNGFSPEEIFLTEAFAAERYDVFLVHRIGMEAPLLISERLKIRLEDEGVTGLEIREQEFVVV